MASKSVYQPYESTALTHFGLDGDPMYGVLSTNMTIDEVVCSENEKQYDNIASLLSKNTLTNGQWKTMKKAFVLPKCPVSLDRIKSAAKEHNIVITNDYELADFIITHDEFSQNFSHGELIKSTVMLSKIWNYDAIEDTGGRIPAVDNSGLFVLYDKKFQDHVTQWNCTVDHNVYDRWLITPMAANIAYRIDTGSLGVVHADDLLGESQMSQDLTEELLSTIKVMLNSNNDDRKLLAKILPTVNTTKNYHLIWELAKELAPMSYHFTREKDFQYWYDQAKIEFFYRKSAEAVILWLEENNLLTSVEFRYLEPIVRREIQIYNRDLYTVQVAVKTQYKQFLK